MNTPIIFIIFKRPTETAKVFEEIRKARPTRLFVVSDGPRNEEERILVEQTRKIIKNVDWPCEVLTDYSQKNLGCRRRVWSGLDWAFSKLENDTDGAIILEDDCLPDQTFFVFAEEMLKKYAPNPQIMHIGGACFQHKNHKLSTDLSTKLSTDRNIPDNESYYFSRISQIWGWATWKRAWKMYDGSLTSWPKLKDSMNIRSSFPTRTIYHYWRYMFDQMYKGTMDTWDIAWTYTIFKENKLCVMPYNNMIKNIGFGIDATHKISAFTNIPTTPLIFPIRHPKEIKVNLDADLFTYKTIFGIKHNTMSILKTWTKDNLPFLFKYVKSFVK